MTAATDHDAAVKSKEQELKALGVAKEAMVNSTGAAAAQQYGSASFLQLAGSNPDGSLVQVATGAEARMHLHATLAHFELVALVRSLGKKNKDRALMQLADRIKS